MQKSRVQRVLLLAFCGGLLLAAWPLAALADVVHFKELMAILAIDPPQGWEVAEKPRGSTTKAPVQMSEAHVEFKAGEDKRLEVRIMDMPGGAALFMGLAQAVEMESSEEYIKPVTIQDHKGIETYRFKDKDGEIQLPVANRFLVTVKGSGLDNTEMLQAVAAKLDLKKLAALAK